MTESQYCERLQLAEWLTETNVTTCRCYWSICMELSALMTKSHSVLRINQRLQIHCKKATKSYVLKDLSTFLTIYVVIGKFLRHIRICISQHRFSRLWKGQFTTLDLVLYQLGCAVRLLSCWTKEVKLIVLMVTQHIKTRFPVSPRSIVQLWWWDLNYLIVWYFQLKLV